MGIQRFEEIKAWQDARVLTAEIYKLCSEGKPSKDFVFRDQIQRACISVMSNIAEGFERGGNPEFIQFLSIAKGSCGELESQLLLSADVKYLDHDRLQELRVLIRRVAAIFRSLTPLPSRHLRHDALYGPQRDPDLHLPFVKAVDLHPQIPALLGNQHRFIRSLDVDQDGIGTLGQIL